MMIRTRPDLASLAWPDVLTDAELVSDDDVNYSMSHAKAVMNLLTPTASNVQTA